MAKKKPGMSLVPAAARPPVPSQVRSNHDIPLRIRSSITAFEQQIGGRDALIEALSTGDSDESVQAVLDILGDPENDDRSLATLCGQAGISPGQLFEAFRRAATVRGQVLSILTAAEKVPTITAEVARTALPHEQICQACNGEGSFDEKLPDGTMGARRCTACNGVGKIRRDADPDQQQKIFELTGLLKSGGGTQVTQNMNVLAPAAAVMGGSLEQLQQVVSELIYKAPGVANVPTASALEAEVVESPPDGSA